MNPLDNKALEVQFEKAWKKWLERPPRQSPSEAAARVGVLIHERRRRRQARWVLAAAAAVFCVVISVAIQWTRLSTHPTSGTPAAGIQQAPQLGDGEVLIWIDNDTPLYMTFQSPDENRGKGEKL